MKGQATIIRHKRKREFTTLPNSILNGDTGLSLKATGLLCHLLAKPEDWKTYVTEVATHFRGKNGKESIWSALAELRKTGYAKLDLLRDENGHIEGKVWRISDEPEFFCKQKPLEAPSPAKPVAGVLPATENPDTGKTRGREKPPLLNTDQLQKTDQKQKTEEQQKGADAPGIVAASQSGAAAPEPSPEAKALITLWKQDYQVWHCARYKAKKPQEDQKAAEQLFQGFPKARPMDFRWLALKTWLSVKEQDGPVTENKDGSTRHDPYFHSSKAQWSVAYFCNHIDDVIKEQEESFSNLVGKVSRKEMDDMEATIQIGREADEPEDPQVEITCQSCGHAFKVDAEVISARCRECSEIVPGPKSK